jgi:hypothetical protein
MVRGAGLCGGAEALTPRSATRQADGPHFAPGEYAEGTLTPALSQRERESYREVVQFRFAQTLTRPLPSAISAALRFPRGEEKGREAIWRLNPAIPEEARAVVKRCLNTRFERRQNP